MATDLEQRVKSLEYEVAMLKNEIQRTLLEIQEQILIRYYPDLRCDDEPMTEGVLQSFDAVRHRKVQVESDTAQAKVRQITLEEARTLRQQPPANDSV